MVSFFALEPKIELNMFWTNLGESDQEIIGLYMLMENVSNFIVKSKQIWV